MKIKKLNIAGFTSVTRQIHTKAEEKQIAIAAWFRGYFNLTRLAELMKNKEGSPKSGHDLRSGIR